MACLHGPTSETRNDQEFHDRKGEKCCSCCSSCSCSSVPSLPQQCSTRDSRDRFFHERLIAPRSSAAVPIVESCGCSRSRGAGSTPGRRFLCHHLLLLLDRASVLKKKKKQSDGVYNSIIVWQRLVHLLASCLLVPVLLAKTAAAEERR